jgi:hypothetical protein
VADLENSLDQSHAFDDILQASSVYSRTLLDRSGDAEIRDIHTSASVVEPSDLPLGQTDTPSECTDIPASSEAAVALAITASFAADVENLSDDRYADTVNRQVHLTDDDGECQMVSALLDTGANRNSIAEAKVSSLRLEAATRRLSPPVRIRAADGWITVPLVVKGKWRFPQKTKFYTHWFYVVPNLPHDIVICRNVILKHDLLMDNPELCSLALPDELKTLPELLIMGMSELSKGKFHEQLHLGESADSRKAAKKDQDERTAAKEKENREQRDKEANEIRERLAAQASSSTAPANASGSASSSGSSNTMK